MADTRTTILPSEPQPPSSPTYPHTPTKAQAGSFGNRTTSFSFPALDPGRAESASVNGNGNGYSSAPRRQYHLSTTAAGAASSDGASSIPDVRNVYGSVSPTSHGAQSPGHRRDASGSQLARTNASHATALSDALHETPASSSMTTSPQTLKHCPQPLQQPPLARRLSTDRRVRSEAIPEARRHMSISGRRPSVLTGGYESSTDDEDEHEAGQEQGQKRRRGASGVFGGPSNNGQNGQPEMSMATHASRAHLSGNRRRAQSLMVNPTLQFSPPISPARRPSRLRPPGSPFRSGSGTGSPGGPLRVTSDQHPLAQSSRNPSMRSNRSIAEDKGRERKRQSKLPETRRNPLAESLGLGVASRQVVLSPDQIQDLLSDVDVSSAMQMMAKPLRRQSSVVEGGSGTAPPPPPKASPPMASRPFLVSAPPPLTTGDWVGRDRGISVSSSVATPLRNVTPAGPIRRPRTMSMATSDSDGGHVPFTHHVSPNPPPQAESDIEEADETMLAPPVDLDAPPVSPQPVPIDNTAPASPKRDKKRISGLFNLRKKPRQSSPPPTPRQRVPSPHHDGAAFVQRDREAEQRRAEAERREEELAQERRYRAMMQIHAHPYSQRRAQRCAVHFDAYYSLVYQGIEQPPKVNSLAVIRWVKRTEEQRDARKKWEESQREGSDLQRHVSPSSFPMGFHSNSSVGYGDSSRFLTSPNPLRSSLSRSRSTTDLPPICPGWHYSIENIQVYRACNGKVDFFIPPTPQIEEAESAFSGDAETPYTAEEHVPLSVTSSNVDYKTNGVSAHAAIASPSLPSLLGSGDPHDVALSRATSIDNGRKNIRSHRTYNSTSGIPQKPLQALRVPFERAKGTLSRRTVTTPSNAHPPSDAEEDLAVVGKRFSASQLRESPYSGHTQSVHAHSMRDRNPLRRRRHETPITSDDEHHKVRGLIARGARGTMDMLSRRPPSGGTDLAPGSRSTELRNLEQVFVRERNMRESQARNARKIELEEQAEERIQRVENEICAEREDLLQAGRRRLEQAEQADSQMELAITHYLTQLDQVRQVFRSAADIDVTFTNLDDLRKPLRIEHDEAADSLAPLLVDSDRGYFSASGRPKRTPRRAPTISALSLPSFAHGLTAWPKRSTLDPTLGITTDPLHRVEFSCSKARDTLISMGDERAAATRTMQDMVGTINNFIEQKDLVRAWIKAANERLAQLRLEKANISIKIKGGVRPRMSRASDVATDLVARGVMSLFSYGIRIARALTWIRGVESAWLAWAIVGSLIALGIGFFWAAGGDVGGAGANIAAGMSGAAVAGMSGAAAAGAAIASAVRGEDVA